jgi:hypothetical protein
MIYWERTSRNNTRKASENRNRNREGKSKRREERSGDGTIVMNAPCLHRDKSHMHPLRHHLLHH